MLLSLGKRSQDLLCRGASSCAKRGGSRDVLSCPSSSRGNLPRCSSQHSVPRANGVTSPHMQRRFFSDGRGGGGRGKEHGKNREGSSEGEEEHRRVAYNMGAVAVFVFGLSYASVPLYKLFCQVTGFGGTTQRADDSKAATIKPVDGARVIKVDFTGDVHSAMPWKFKPTQRDVRVLPGETALAFYTVSNPTAKAITGVATYNVYPPKAGLYFNKIQCFCFEEQRLAAKEEIDMPVFFYIDPEIVDDPAMRNVSNITLSYTFFKTGQEEELVEEEEIISASTKGSL